MSTKQCFKYVDLARHANLKGSVKAVLRVLCDFAGKGPIVYPCVQRIADESGYSKRTVTTCLATLQELGLVQRVGKNGPHGSNKYKIIETALQEISRPPRRRTQESSTATGPDREATL
jgi:predicted transcriptional regulator